MIEYKFSKAFLTEKDFLKEIPASKATFHRWQREWIANGNDPRDMGKILIKGSSIVYWDGQLWLKWFFNHKVNQKVQFDYVDLKVCNKKQNLTVHMFVFLV